MGMEIGLWNRVKWKLSTEYPSFSSAFSVLQVAETEEAVPGSDGIYLYDPKSWESSWADENLSRLCQLYLHTVLHCFFGHILLGTGKQKDCWDLACDIYVEYVMKKDFSRVWSMDNSDENVSTKERREKQNEILKILSEKVKPFHTEALYQELLKREDIEEWSSIFYRECHKFWDKNNTEEYTAENVFKSTAQLEKKSLQRLKIGKQWERIRQFAEADKGQLQGRRGSAGGNQSFEMTLKKQKKYDYRRFLERFTFAGEEMQMDLDSFDYIPYTYSRQNYENLVFLEPLEYAEVHKLRELIIAIDTSGSCRGKIVKQFLEETYEILSRKENFFRKMKVHLIQCDSFIQEYVCIESQEQWQEYVRKLMVHGFGGTDFRPVFQLVEDLRKKKEIQQPGGLIYFTDGDGIYPEKAPDYETAFVFLNDSLKKGKVPSWAIELNLQLKLEDEE